MRNLTLASAKHLLSQGHITKQHHDRIVKSAGAAPQLPQMPKMPTGPGGAGLLRGGQPASPVAPGRVPGLMMPQDDPGDHEYR